ncbi:MAG: S8 family serine peptidase [Clostridiales bacterium]|nr:S8 family serine peptidase [Clostridiales bacterium]
MNDQKLEDLLNLALEATEEEREKSSRLSVGYDRETRLWDVIIKYSGSESRLTGPGISLVPLLGGYGVATVPETELNAWAARPGIEFVEKPRRLYFSTYQAETVSCIRSVQTGEGTLTGRGILVGVVDSGVDYRHPDFRNPDGTTRILRLWDQSLEGRPPEGYILGTEYTEEEINAALALPEAEGRRLLPVRDLSGHGTAVLGIAAGNGRGEESGIYRGVAYESDLLVVKLGSPRKDSFPRTVELMQGLDYLVRQALALGKPAVINLSFGNNYGSHRGDSLLETYMNTLADMGRLVFCTGTGNNGALAVHTGDQIGSGEEQEVLLRVGEYEPNLNIQLWKAYEDEVEILLENPSGARIGPFSEKQGAQRFYTGGTELLIYYGKPGPYHVTQEIYLDFLPLGNYVDSGVWRICLRGRRVKNGKYFLWLPGGNTLNEGTAFYNPQAFGTLTIPSTASKIISVGAYDSRLDAYADFSGRGSREFPDLKPDLVAPGVNITAPRPGGGYAMVTGTSFSTPFVSGSAALMMQWGIVNGNDPYLYGEKVKAYLRRGARELPGYTRWPNEQAGYGALCLWDSLPPG